MATGPKVYIPCACLEVHHQLSGLTYEIESQPHSAEYLFWHHAVANLQVQPDLQSHASSTNRSHG